MLKKLINFVQNKTNEIMKSETIERTKFVYSHEELKNLVISILDTNRQFLVKNSYRLDYYKNHYIEKTNSMETHKFYGSINLSLHIDNFLKSSSKNNLKRLNRLIYTNKLHQSAGQYQKLMNLILSKYVGTDVLNIKVVSQKHESIQVARKKYRDLVNILKADPVKIMKEAQSEYYKLKGDFYKTNKIK